MLPPIAFLAVAKSATSVHEVPSQLSVFATNGVGPPPKANAFVLEDPEPANKLLAVFNSLTSVHAEPFQLSVLAVALPVSPPATTAAVVVPAPIPSDLAVLIAVELVKDDPL